MIKMNTSVEGDAVGEIATTGIYLQFNDFYEKISLKIYQTCDLLIKIWCHHFEFLALSSARPDSIFWNKFEEKLFRWLI
jgi:hypothetical protein